MSIREAIEDAVNTAESGQTEQATPVAETTEVPVVEAAVPETEEQKAGRTAGRARDEHGRLMPGKAEKPVVAAPVVPAVFEKPKIQPPSSWGKDRLASWDKIAETDVEAAKYILEREKQFQGGVSTYKQEFERVKPIDEAMQQFMPDLQRNGIKPEQFITQLGTAHQRLVYGSPQEKLQMFAKLAQDYRVPLQALYDPQVQQQFLMQQTMQPPAPQQDVRALVQEQMNEVMAKHDLQQFQTATGADGKPLYPHYERLREDMALLLELGKAQDLQSAYAKALPMHDDIWQQEQAAKQAAAQKTAQEVQTRQVAKAKAAAVSTKSATPAGEPAKATKGIRAALENAYDATVAEGGRV